MPIRNSDIRVHDLKVDRFDEIQTGLTWTISNISGINWSSGGSISLQGGSQQLLLDEFNEFARLWSPGASIEVNTPFAECRLDAPLAKMTLGGEPLGDTNGMYWRVSPTQNADGVDSDAAMYVVNSGAADESPIVVLRSRAITASSQTGLSSAEFNADQLELTARTTQVAGAVVQTLNGTSKTASFTGTTPANRKWEAYLGDEPFTAGQGGFSFRTGPTTDFVGDSDASVNILNSSVATTAPSIYMASRAKLEGVVQTSAEVTLDGDSIYLRSGAVSGDYADLTAGVDLVTVSATKSARRCVTTFGTEHLTSSSGGFGVRVSPSTSLDGTDSEASIIIANTAALAAAPIVYMESKAVNAGVDVDSGQFQIDGDEIDLRVDKANGDFIQMGMLNANSKFSVDVSRAGVPAALLLDVSTAAAALTVNSRGLTLTSTQVQVTDGVTSLLLNTAAGTASLGSGTAVVSTNNGSGRVTVSASDQIILTPSSNVSIQTGWLNFSNTGGRIPANSADPMGVQGDVIIANGFIYAKDAVGWKRSALSTF